MTCLHCRSAIATTRYVYGLGALRRLTVLCDQCAANLQAIGMDLRAERSAQVDNRPAWVRNLRAKDFTGSIA